MTQKDPEGPRRTQKSRRTQKDSIRTQKDPIRTKKDPVGPNKVEQLSQSQAFQAGCYFESLSSIKGRIEAQHLVTGSSCICIIYLLTALGFNILMERN